jgi:SPP1 gp7 family putative phage head morphogenesis protein
MRSLTKFDSVFSPILSQFTQVSPLDKWENEFVQRMVTLVQVESNALIKSLKSATSEEDIDKARWNLLPRMQQLLWYLWRDGWALGKDSALKDLRMAGFSVGDDWAEFAFQSDNSAGNRRSQRDRISDLKTPLEDSRVKKAIEDRTLELSGDFEQNTKDEIKNAFRDFNKDKDKEGARARLEERIARAIGANDGQDERKVRKTAARAKRIARTELTGAYNTARVDSFVSAGVRRFIWITDVREKATCEICLSRNRVVYDISEIPSNPPPVHPYCGCTLQPVREDDPRVKKAKNLAGAIAPIAAGWLFGKAADKVGAAIDAIPEKEEKENDLWKKVLLAGGAALGLAGIYYLVTRNPNVKQAAQKGVVEAVEEVADQAEAYQQRRRAAEGLSEEKQPSILEQGTVTAASLPPEIRNSLPPGLANSNADIRNIQASEISRRTGLSPKEAERIKLQIEGFLADNPIKPEGKTVNNMTVKELKELGLTPKQISEVKKRKRNGELFVTIDDLKNIPGIGDRKVEQMKRRMEEKDNPSLVVNGRRIDDLSIKELKENLGLKQNQALAVKEYLRKNRITKVEDLKNVPGIGKVAIAIASRRLADIKPRANINNFGDKDGVSNVNLLAERAGISMKLAEEITQERKVNGDFKSMEDMESRINKRRKDRGAKRLDRTTISKISNSLEFLPEGEEIQPLDLAPKQELKPLPAKNRPIRQRREILPPQEPLPDVRPPKTIARRLSPEERVNAAALEDERQYRELANEVRAYHTIPGTSRKITKQVKQRIEQNASVVARQQEAYRTADSAVSNAINRIDSIENDVAKLEEAYRTGQNIEEAKKAYLEAIARTEGELDAAGRVLSNANELDTAIERTSRVRTAAEQSIADNVNRKARQEALDAKLKAARVDTTDLEADLQRDRTLESIDNQITQLDRLSAVIREDPNNIRGNIQNSKARLEELKNRVNQASEQRASLKQQYQQRFSVLQQEINDVEAQISEVKTQLNFAEKKVQRYRVETARLRRDTSADPSAIAKAERELNRWETTKDSTSRELRSLNRRLTNLKKQRKTNKDTRGYSSGGKLAMFVSNMRRGL